MFFLELIYWIKINPGINLLNKEALKILNKGINNEDTNIVPYRNAHCIFRYHFSFKQNRSLIKRQYIKSPNLEGHLMMSMSVQLDVTGRVCIV